MVAVETKKRKRKRKEVEEVEAPYAVPVPPMKKKKKVTVQSLPFLSSPCPSPALLPYKDGDEECIFLRVVDAKDQQLKWYGFDYNGFFGKKDDPEQTRGRPRGFSSDMWFQPPLDVNKDTPCYPPACFAVIDDNIYCIGGQSFPDQVSSTRKVHVIEASRPKLFSEKVRSMCTARYDPQAVALDGKIFVMGGISGGGCGDGDDSHSLEQPPWAEVYHPKPRKWVPLPSPPSSKAPSQVSGLFSSAIHDHNKVLIGSNLDPDFLFMYDVATECWQHLDNGMPYSPRNARPVCVGTTLFWFEDSMLHAYDFLGKWGCSGYIQGLHNIVPPHKFSADSFTSLLHIADNGFCLICLDGINARQGLSIVHLVNFYVSNLPVSSLHGSLNAVVDSSLPYLIKKSTLILDAALFKYTDNWRRYL